MRVFLCMMALMFVGCRATGGQEGGSGLKDDEASGTTTISYKYTKDDSGMVLMSVCKGEDNCQVEKSIPEEALENAVGEKYAATKANVDNGKLNQDEMLILKFAIKSLTATAELDRSVLKDKEGADLKIAIMTDFIAAVFEEVDTGRARALNDEVYDAGRSGTNSRGYIPFNAYIYGRRILTQTAVNVVPAVPTARCFTVKSTNCSIYVPQFWANGSLIIRGGVDPARGKHCAATPLSNIYHIQMTVQRTDNSIGAALCALEVHVDENEGGGGGGGGNVNCVDFYRAECQEHSDQCVWSEPQRRCYKGNGNVRCDDLDAEACDERYPECRWRGGRCEDNQG